MREAAAGLVAILHGREERAQEQGEAVRILMFGQCLPHQFQRIAADLVHAADAVEAIALRPVDGEFHLGIAHVVDGEAIVEQADEGAERTGGVIVLRLAQKQGGTPFEIAEIDVVAERRADSAP